MAQVSQIVDYASLQQAIAEHLNRADLTAKIPLFIQMAEAAYNKDPRGRIQDSVVVSEAIIGLDLTPVPADYIKMQRLRIPASTDNFDGLQLLTSQQVGWYSCQYNTAGEPLYYSIIGKRLRLLPIPDQSYTFEMEYYSKLPALSTTNTTNWLLTDNPDIYLYGALMQAEPYLKNDERIATWGKMYGDLMEALHATDQEAQFSGDTMKMRTRSFG
jgi:hypothetical protein